MSHLSTHVKSNHINKSLWQHHCLICHYRSTFCLKFCGMVDERDEISGEDGGGEQSRADNVAMLHLP